MLFRVKNFELKDIKVTRDLSNFRWCERLSDR